MAGRPVTLTFQTVREGEPPHRKVVRAKAIEFTTVYEATGEWDHIWLILRNAGNHHEIARLYEPGSEWVVGDFGYATLQIT